MNVLLLNGSPHEHGCTDAALREVAASLNACGVETELIWAGADNAGGCRGCGVCRKTGRCVQGGLLNELLPKLADTDGLVLGAPVHYASPAGGFIGLLDRLFFAGGAALCNKPGAAVVSCRRAGSTAALEVLQKYINYSNMPLVASQYWPMVHGACPEDVQKDLEGLQIMRQLGRNMAWLLKCIALGREAGLQPPEHEAPARTNFIR